MSTPAAIFQALAAGHDLKEVGEQFQLTSEQLQELFLEMASHFRDLADGVWRLYCDGASRGNPGHRPARGQS